MSLINLEIKEFLEEVDSIKPAPGGGTSSALISSLGISLIKMVGHLTFNKKRFLAFHEEDQKIFKDVLVDLTKIKEELIILIDEDTKAYNQVVKAFKLPKQTEKEKAIRQKEIELGTLYSTKVPYQILTLSLKALRKLEIILKCGNPNAISDLGVGALSLATGAEGAILNVLINLPGIKDKELKDYYLKETSKAKIELKEIRDNILTGVYKIITE